MQRVHVSSQDWDFFKFDITDYVKSVCVYCTVKLYEWVRWYKILLQGMGRWTLSYKDVRPCYTPNKVDYFVALKILRKFCQTKQKK